MAMKPEVPAAAGIVLAVLSAAGAIARGPDSAPPRVVLDAPGHVVVEGEPAVARGGVPGAVWTLLDWRGRPTGETGTFDGDGTACIPAPPTGFYRLAAPDADGNGAPRRDWTTFAVVPAPVERTAASDASFYAVDSAQTWLAAKGLFECPWNGGDAFRTVSDLLRLAGIPHVRERMSWAAANPQPGVFRYGIPAYNAELLRARGIGVGEIFSDTPRRMTRMRECPFDLAAVYDSCARIAADFGDRMEVWECWNEPDLGIAPAWDDAAALKAAYLGAKAGHPQATVLPGALCMGTATDYIRVLYGNDAAKFGDAFNWHTYAPPSEYPGIFATLRTFLDGHGAARRAIWVTECGTNLEGPAKDDGAMAGMKAHAPAQELVLAEFYPKAQIALQMAGVSRAYHFVFCPFNERDGTKDWGVMRRDGSVKPVYAAMAAMVRELGDARLAGELHVGDDGIRAYLFDLPDGSQTVAFWAVSPVDTAAGSAVVGAEPDFAREMRLALPDGASRSGSGYRVCDLCGAVSTATAWNGVLALRATRFPAYATGLRGLVADVPPVAPGLLGPYVPADDEDLAVVLRVDLDPDDFEIENHRSRARLKGDSGRLRLQVWNLGDESKTGRVDIAGAVLAGVPDVVSLGPRGTPPAEFDCVLHPDGGDAATPTVVLSGVFGGRRTSRLAVPLLLESRLFAGCTAEPLAWSDAANWTRNDSASRYSLSWEKEEKALRFDVSWDDSAVDRWFFPVYALRPGETLDGAVAIEFEVKSAQDKVENDFVASYCMLLRDDGPERWLGCTPPIGSWEKRIAFFGGTESTADVKAFRIGANPKGMRLSWWVRNVRALRHRDVPPPDEPAADAPALGSGVNGEKPTTGLLHDLEIMGSPAER